MRTRRWPATLAALFIAVALFASPASASSVISLTTYGYGASRAGYNSSESTLGVSNASSLHKLWGFNFGGATITQPVVAADVSLGSSRGSLVFVGSENGKLYAVNAADGKLVWSRSLGMESTGCGFFPNSVFGLSGTPAIDKSNGIVYAAGGNGKLYAMGLTTGKLIWSGKITSDPGHEYVYSAVTRSNGNLYVELASYCDVSPYHGRIEEWSTSKHARIHTFWVTKSSSGPSGGGIWGQAGVSIDSNGYVYVATGNALTSPENYGYSNAVVRLTSSLGVKAYDKPSLTGSDVDFGATPMLFQPPSCPLMLAVENKSGVLFVYKAGSIGSGDFQRLQVGDVNDGQFNAIPAYDPVTNMLYVANSSDSSTGLDHQGLVAFQVQSNCKLATPPVWEGQANLGYPVSVSPPTVANGVVYYGDGSGNTEFAFDALDGTPLWNSGSTISGGIWAAPSVVNGRLYVGSWDGHLYSFGP